MRTNIKASLNSLHLSDVYSLMLFLLYKVQDVPEYAVLSELCYLLDGSNITRLFTYFAGKTVTFPTEEEFVILVNALLLYQYVNDLTPKKKEKVRDLYLQILPVIKQYNIDREQVQKNDR